MDKQPRGLNVDDVKGWILVCKDEDCPEWHIAWMEPFSTKKAAMAFATEAHWPKNYRAMRGRISVD